MKKLTPLFLLLGLVILLTGCVTTEPETYYNYSAFRSADPHSILIVPVVNNTVDVDAFCCN